MTIEYIIALFLLYIVTLFAGSFLVTIVLKPFHPADLPAGMKNAGKLIGFLERSLILSFFLMNQMSLIGFILTIKAVYRYGDIQGDPAQKMKTSEYFIIGTLTSLLFTILFYSLFLVAVNYFQV